MAKRSNARHVFPRPDGSWGNKRQGSSRVSKVYKTQKAAVQDAQKMLEKEGGGRLIMHGRDGRILSSNTISGVGKADSRIGHRVFPVFSIRNRNPARRKVIFVAFAIEDERQRDFLKGQSLNTNSPFDYVDMSVKEPYDKNWKARVRTRIRRSDALIALVSKDSLTSTGQKWEIECAREEKKRVLGVWAYSHDRTKLRGVRTVPWSWGALEKFINSL